MDAHAHLLSLGWAGPGHSLDSRPYKQKGHRGLAYDPAKVGNNGVGLVKPLLISQRKGRFGVGKKAHEPPAGNQWWLKGFENALGNIGKSESERSSGTATPIAHDSGAGKHGGLYSFFVKGQEMEGTIGKVGDVKRTSKKRKSDALDDREHDGAVASKKQEAAAEFEEAGAYFALRDKDEKRYQRLQKQNPVAEFKQVGEYLQAGLEKREKRRKSKVESEFTELDTPVDVDNEGRSPPSQVETKEERRERRRQRKEKKEQKRNALADLENPQQPALPNDAVAEDMGAKAHRRAERKRRKSDKSTKSLEGG